MNGSDVVVVIPTYGRQALVDRAVRSAFRADPEVEVIVVDDASPTPIRPPEGARVVRHETNLGVAAARNTGVEASDRPVITFLDSDDWWLPGRLHRVLPDLSEAPVALCWAQYEGGGRGRGRDLNGDVSSIIAADTTPHVGVTTLLREVWVPFDPAYRTCQDIEWWTRLAEGAPVRTTPEVLCVIGRHDGIRYRSTTEARIASSERLLRTPYFRNNRRARAFRLYRIGLMARSIGDTVTARRAFRAATLTLPRLRFGARWIRSLLPGDRA